MQHRNWAEWTDRLVPGCITASPARFPKWSFAIPAELPLGPRSGGYRCDLEAIHHNYALFPLESAERLRAAEGGFLE